MQDLLYTYGRIAGPIAVYVTVWFAIALVLRRNDVADVAWGPGFLLIAVVSLATHGVRWDRGMLTAILVVCWSVRLAAHIGWRNRGKAEDARYRAWREAWGSWFLVRTYLQVFVLQGVLMLVIAAPVVVATTHPGAPLGWLDGLGVVIWGVGFAWETIADAQLARFKRDPASRGGIIETGLWQYSRHPNYFGEVMLWWGIWLVSLSSPQGWVGAIGPACITFLILKVSGVPLLERQMADRPGFAAYARRVNAFLPGPPRPR